MSAKTKAAKASQSAVAEINVNSVRAAAHAKVNKAPRVMTLAQFATRPVVRQGDVYLIYVGPSSRFKTIEQFVAHIHANRKGYSEGWWDDLKVPTEQSQWSPAASTQLAQGNTKGASHIIDSYNGGQLPKIEISQAQFVAVGPRITASETFLLRHDEHAHFVLPACEEGGTYHTFFQVDPTKQVRVRD